MVLGRLQEDRLSMAHTPHFPSCIYAILLPQISFPSVLLPRGEDNVGLFVALGTTIVIVLYGMLSRPDCYKLQVTRCIRGTSPPSSRQPSAPEGSLPAMTRLLVAS